MSAPTRPAGQRVEYVESERTPGHFYQVTPTSCSCEQFRFRLAGSGGRCKHQQRAFPTPDPALTPAEVCAERGHDWHPIPAGGRPLPLGYAADRCGRCGAVRERRVDPPSRTARSWGDVERQQEAWR